ncbi:septal ring lytic transglycosylase RlpA family protein [Asticcacaulis sp. EMRT-3]|uniref:septal ring lytic transglycosylase RlpA family protein n=1 Tax=Asticcacaulis sp. EMRT-3 TaxID=3040349 RepID=UPI0024AFAA9C|nr:septal ring lytic transglycosylase RlpA family protein [Asticcacaulis sp. EMRT-3]MDI7774499.1 septal ring lytic transglycosylase RlpA family protein [Asticcacaulis sp. EMRT-3]
MAALGGCASGPRYSAVPGGASVASDSHYNSGNFKPYNVGGRTYYPSVPDKGYTETGTASWYAEESGTRTADGEVFNPDGISAAHKTFPLPCVVEVTNLDNGKSIRLRVNDRGPFVSGRIMDLSRGAAKVLGVYATGTARVRITWLGPADSITNAPVTYASNAAGDDDRYIVQLGAFSDKDNAERAQGRLDQAKIDRRHGLYVVYLGPFRGASAAENQRQSAIDAGFRDAILAHDG